ncbi:MAG: ABC transporter ATP-binding protein, partial [Actinobacteria bacterium]|nr:ABC transporter ATP-binding protein [Actinomycetota bacterium]
MTEALRFEDVTFTYPGSDAPALRRIDLSIEEGHFVLVTGPTGSGKSTFLRMANGLVPHFSGGAFEGRVFAEGRDTLGSAPRELADIVAFVPQDPAASFVLDRVEDELAYGMENLSVSPDRMRRRVEEVLDLMAIAKLRDRSVRTLSGGEQQRVAIAAALAAGPRILVLDEPTSQLDPQGAEDVLAGLLRLVHDLGMTVLVSEHRLERVAGFADMAVGLPGDASAFMGSPQEVLTRLKSGPPVTRLARRLGWEPVPLTVRDARTRASSIQLPLPTPVAAPDPGEDLLRCEGLKAGYHDTPVLAGIDLRLGAGEALALLGRNGSGKTTLLRSLAGLHSPSHGRVVARSGSAPATGLDVAYCPQDPDVLLFADTVEKEVRATLDARRSDASPADLLELVG